MTEFNLNDHQWCVLDMLMRARQRGIDRLNRMEILTSRSLPIDAQVRLVFAALIMPKELVTWHDHHNFGITDEGISLYNLRFDNREPTGVADVVICLPGPEHYEPKH